MKHEDAKSIKIPKEAHKIILKFVHENKKIINIGEVFGRLSELFCEDPELKKRVLEKQANLLTSNNF